MLLSRRLHLSTGVVLLLLLFVLQLTRPALADCLCEEACFGVGLCCHPSDTCIDGPSPQCGMPTQSGTAIDCDDGNECTIEQIQYGCTAADCEDNRVDGVGSCTAGNFCDGSGTCVKVGDDRPTCDVGAPPTCDDNNECTLDACDRTLEVCTHTRIEDNASCQSNGDDLKQTPGFLGLDTETAIPLAAAVILGGIVAFALWLRKQKELEIKDDSDDDLKSGMTSGTTSGMTSGATSGMTSGVDSGISSGVSSGRSGFSSNASTFDSGLTSGSAVTASESGGKRKKSKKKMNKGGSFMSLLESDLATNDTAALPSPGASDYTTGETFMTRTSVGSSGSRASHGSSGGKRRKKKRAASSGGSSGGRRSKSRGSRGSRASKGSRSSTSRS